MIKPSKRCITTDKIVFKVSILFALSGLVFIKLLKNYLSDNSIYERSIVVNCVVQS